MAAAQNAVRAAAAALRDQKAALAERKVAAQSRLLDLLEAEAAAGRALLDGAAAECERGLGQLEGLAGDLRAALRSAEPGACSAAAARADRLLRQLLDQLASSAVLEGGGGGAGPLGQALGGGAAGALSAMACRVSQLERQVACWAAQQPTRGPGSGPGAEPEEARPASGCGEGEGGCAPEAVCLELAPPPAGGSRSLAKLQALAQRHAAHGSGSPGPKGPGATAQSSPPRPAAASCSLKAQYQAMLASLQERHAKKLQELRARHAGELARQVGGRGPGGCALRLHACTAAVFCSSAAISSCLKRYCCLGSLALSARRRRARLQRWRP